MSALQVEILRGETSGLPAAGHAAALLGEDVGTLTLSCTDASEAYTVLRTIMTYSYTHALPSVVRLICADDTVYRAYRFQWNMWYAERKPE